MGRIGVEGRVRLIRSDGGLGGRGALAEARKQGYQSRGSVLAPRTAMRPAEPWCRGSHRSDVVSMNPNSALPTCGTCNTQHHRTRPQICTLSGVDSDCRLCLSEPPKVAQGGRMILWQSQGYASRSRAKVSNTNTQSYLSLPDQGKRSI